MQSRLERYLDEVSRPLTVAERVEWRNEAEQHLSALVAAYEELGHSHEEATELALAKFGDAQRLGLQMETETLKSLPPALKAVAALFALQGLMCWAITIPRFLEIGIINEGLLIWGAPAFFIAHGLLKRRAGARTAGIALICLTVALATPMSVIGANWVVGKPPLLAAWRVLLYVLIPAWELWVLTRTDVKALFDTGKPKKRFWARR